MKPIPQYPTTRDVPITAEGTWPATVHRFDERGAAALRAAEACGRPLLIRGAPGVGKSQTARAAAAFARRPFLSAVIDGRTEPNDLKWRFDAVGRLADAQVKEPGVTLATEARYLEPQGLWWAYDWAGAKRQRACSRQAELAGSADATQLPATRPRGWEPDSDRAVLLIDEIDKADPDLPNALLEVLANKGFQVPYTGQSVACTDETRPIVVITTNEERELPNAFLRRCLVLTLELPSTQEALCDYLVAMGERHEKFRRKAGRPGTCFVKPLVAERLWVRREQARKDGLYLPGTSEYLDLVAVLAELFPDEAAQRKQLGLLDEFTFNKSASRAV